MPMPGISSKQFHGFNYNSDTTPLLESSYGSIKKNGLPLPAELSTGKKSDVIVATIGDKSVFITDLKGARELINDHHGMPWDRLGDMNTTESYGGLYDDDDTLVVLSGDDLGTPWAENGKKVGKSSLNHISVSSGANNKQSKEHSLIKDFLQFIQDFRFGGYDKCDNSWRCKIPIIITGLLLILITIFAFIWLVQFRGGFIEGKEVNFHPMLMITGFFLFSGFSMLFYRTLRRCDKLKVKLLHTGFHFASLICVYYGYVAIRNNLASVEPQRASFSTLHAWLGLATMFLFFSQFLVGFASFIMANFMCESLSATWRAILVPNHSTFGVITFVIAAATSVTGLTEKAIFSLQEAYVTSEAREALYVNLLGSFIILATILLVFTLRDERTKRRDQPVICNITQ